MYMCVYMYMYIQTSSFDVLFCSVHFKSLYQLVKQFRCQMIQFYVKFQ